MNVNETVGGLVALFLGFYIALESPYKRLINRVSPFEEFNY